MNPQPDAPSPSLPAALASHAARHPHRPFLFWPEGFDWRWASFAEVAGEVGRLRDELLAASAAAGLESGALVAYPDRPLPGRVALDLAIQAADRTAWPVAGTEPPAAAAAWVEVEPQADGDEGPERAGRGPARLFLPVDRRWLEPAWRRRPPAPGRDDGVSKPPGGPASAAGGAVVADAGAMRRIEAAELLAGAAWLAALLARPAAPDRADREVVVVARSLADPGERRLLAWAVLVGAAVILEPSPGGLVTTAAWARPTVFRGTAGDIAALEIEAVAAEAAGLAGAWLRLRRRVGRPGASPRPFRRLQDLILVGPSPGDTGLELWRRRGVRVHEEAAAARRPAGEWGRMAHAMSAGPQETLAATPPDERRALATTPPGSRPWARFFATTTGLLYLLPGTLAMATLSCLVSWVPPRGNAVSFLARQWARGLLAATGVRIEVELDPAIDPGRGYVVMANHQSYFDVVAMLAVLPGTYRFVAKRSLFLIPVFGWSLWAGGFIPVDRRDKSKARDIWRAAGRRLARGASVLFYPEGTRSHDGRIHAFQRGAFLVALKTGAPILPVGISGAHEVMPRGRLSVVPGTIRVRFGAPVDPRSFGLRSKHDLIGHVRTTISELAGIELAEPAAGPVADG